ncbi:LOW QUALITY PROTEIN: hypothetical protein ACHAW5_004100 [Stephanodiscus triporus]|uniref:Uncharacterized protein n=1 Tax=Stephanodiscus triporus TaxID=2934178 RepID=A0ABD3PKB8_9STRA
MHQGAETVSDRGVEALRAALCATEIRNFELQPNKNADTIRKQLIYCQAGLIHLHQSLGQHNATNHERRKNYLICLYQQAELMFWHQELISKLMSFAESVDDILGISGTEIDTAKKSLDKCKELSGNIYPFMQLLIGKRYVELGLDTAGGEHLIHQALQCLDDVDSMVAKSILSRLGVVEKKINGEKWLMIRTIRGDDLKDNVAVLSKLTKEHLRLAFKGDIHAFKQSLTVLIKFAQSVGTIEKEGYLFGSELYSQAILMLLLVLDDDVFANLTTYLSSFLGQVDITCTKMKKCNSRISLYEDHCDSSLEEDSCFDEDFHIDDLTVSFPAFSGLLTFFFYSPMGANQVQETFLANLFAAVAQEAKQTLHVLRTKCILSNLYLKHGNEEKGLEESEEIKDIYNHDKYSLELVNTYGMDWAILNVATMASTYLFKGQFAACLQQHRILERPND